MMPGWKRYRPRETCLICQHGGSSAHPSGCCYKGRIEEPEVILCLRIEEGSAKHARDGLGFVHILKDQPRQHRPAPPPAGPVIDPAMAGLASTYEKNLPADRLAWLADNLGVSADSLVRLRMGWTGSAFSFPMRSAGSQTVGIRIRGLDSSKWSQRGSLNGLFIPRDLSPMGELWVVEGPTDCAAALDLGLTAIGRPSNTAGLAFILEFCKRFLPRRHVVICRNADPVGSVAEVHTIAGAETLAARLMEEKAASEVSIVFPPVKDMRAFLQQGNTRQDVESLLCCDI